MVPPPSNMEKDAAQALAELLSGPGVARPINMDKASVNVPRTPPVGGIANMAPIVDAPPTSPVGGVANMAPVVDAPPTSPVGGVANMAPIVDAPPTSPVGGVANMAPVVDAPPTSPVGGVTNMAPVVDAPPTSPGGGIANMAPVVDAPPTSSVGGVANMSPVVDAPVVDAPPTFPASSTPPSPLLTPCDTCACEEYLEENNQSIKVLVAMCIGLVNDQKQPIMDITQEPWISMKNQNKIKPLTT